MDEPKKHNKKPGKYYRKKKHPWVLCLCVIALFCTVFISFSHIPDALAPVASSPTQSITPETSAESKDALQSTPAASTVSSENAGVLTEAEFAPELYRYGYILEKYSASIQEKWEFQRFEDEKISYLTMFLSSADSLGYVLIDLDGNGNNELLVSDGNVIYDLYTLTDEGPQWIITGGERNSYVLCEDNIIYNTGSNGAASTIFTAYRWNGKDLSVEQVLIFDYNQNPENPWFLGKNAEDFTHPITETEAQAILDSYQPVELSLLPLTMIP